MLYTFSWLHIQTRFITYIFSRLATYGYIRNGQYVADEPDKVIVFEGAYWTSRHREMQSDTDR
jgi:hypothetical protein